jgi:hypothetical protein
VPLPDWEQHARYFGKSAFTYDATRDIYVCPQGDAQTEGLDRARRGRPLGSMGRFGEAKQWHGMRQFRLRGLMKVNIEGLMIAAGQNLKRLLRARGWGRRPWPNGAAGCTGLLRLACP